MQIHLNIDVFLSSEVKLGVRSGINAASRGFLRSRGYDFTEELGFWLAYHVLGISCIALLGLQTIPF